MSKPKLEFKKLKENAVIPEYGKAIIPGYDGKEYSLIVPEGESFEVVTDEPCVIPLGITADIPEGWHIVFRDAPMTTTTLSLGENNEWILTVLRKSKEVSFGMIPNFGVLLGAELVRQGLSPEEAGDELAKMRKIRDTYTLDHRITYIHLEGDDDE